MKVEYKYGFMNISGVSKDEVELILMSLEDLGNRLYNKSTKPNKTQEEINQILIDLKMVKSINDILDIQYMKYMHEHEFEEADVRVYNEEIQRLN